jgi:hypothetical protein
MATNPNVWCNFDVVCIQRFLLINKSCTTYPAFLITSTYAEESEEYKEVILQIL